MSNTKPYWWPTNPYSEKIFPTMIDDYAELIPDPELRTKISGMLGREFWEIASEAIYSRMMNEADSDEYGDISVSLSRIENY